MSGVDPEFYRCRLFTNTPLKPEHNPHGVEVVLSATEKNLVKDSAVVLCPSKYCINLGRHVTASRRKGWKRETDFTCELRRLFCLSDNANWCCQSCYSNLTKKHQLARKSGRQTPTEYDLPDSRSILSGVLSNFVTDPSLHPVYQRQCSEFVKLLDSDAVSASLSYFETSVSDMGWRRQHDVARLARPFVAGALRAVHPSDADGALSLLLNSYRSFVLVFTWSPRHTI